MSSPDGGGPSSPRVLLVASASAWRDEIELFLEAQWFDPRPRRDGVGLFDDGLELSADVVVVDLALRDPSGVEVCAGVRRRTDLPVLAVTSGDELEVMTAFSLGADAVVHRSTSPRELVARLRALLRRFPDRAATTADVLVHGALVYEISTGAVSVAGSPVALGAAERQLLEALMRRSGRAVAREELVAVLRRHGNDEGDLDAHLRRLRDKLEAHDQVRRIATVRKVGFRLQEVAREAAPR